MTAPDPARVLAVLAEVLAADTDRREEVLDRACGGDARLRGSVAAMVAADAEPPAWLDEDGMAERAAARIAGAMDAGPPDDVSPSPSSGAASTPASASGPAGGDVPQDLATHAPRLDDGSGAADVAARTFDRVAAAGSPPGPRDSRLPSRIGPFRVVRVLGAGGMGIVYEAEQDRPRRTVALKLVRAAGGSPAAARRFEIEIQSLGRLSHPGIVQLLEVGVHEDVTGSHPWFAVEFVPDARPITAYTDGEHLDRGARLRLLAQVCDAVHHGHQRGVIHRDLKPDNVLVDAEGHPKVIDFGIARAAGVDGQLGATLAAGATASGQWVGTPRYMSPEQCSGRVRSVDVRTDTWALGVLAYEMLVGHSPHGDDHSVVTVARRILEEPPVTPRRVDASIPVDVQAVLLMALQKDPDDRYQTAADLAAEFRRLLAGQPVAAMRTRRAYVLRRWAYRHRRRLVAACLLAVALATGTWLSLSAQRERERRQQAARLNEFLGVRREIRDPFVAMPLDPADMDEFERALDAESRAGGLHPLVEADMRTVLAEWCVDLRQFQRAAPHAERALTLRRTGVGGPVQLAETLHAVGRVRYWLADLDGAEAAYREAIELRRQHVGPGSAETVNSLNDLAATLTRQGRLEPAIEMFEEVLEHRTRTLGPTSGWTIATGNNLGVALLDLGRFQEAARRLREAIVGLDAVIAAAGTDAGVRLQGFAVLGRLTLAKCLMALERPIEARGVLEDAGERARTMLPEGSPQHEEWRLATAAWHLDAPAAAGADPSRVAGLLDGLAGTGGVPTAAGVRRDMLAGRAFVALGRPQAAVEPLARAVSAVRDVAGPDRSLVGEVLMAEAARALAAGEVASARTRLAEARSILTESLPPGHPSLRRMQAHELAAAGQAALPTGGPGE